MQQPSNGDGAKEDQRAGSFFRNPTAWTALMVVESLLVVGIATWLGGMSGLSLAAFLAIVIGTGVILTRLTYKLRRRLFGR